MICFVWNWGNRAVHSDVTGNNLDSTLDCYLKEKLQRKFRNNTTNTNDLGKVFIQEGSRQTMRPFQIKIRQNIWSQKTLLTPQCKLKNWSVVACYLYFHWHTDWMKCFCVTDLNTKSYKTCWLEGGVYSRLVSPIAGISTLEKHGDNSSSHREQIGLLWAEPSRFGGCYAAWGGSKRCMRTSLMTCQSAVGCIVNFGVTTI